MNSDKDSTVLSEEEIFELINQCKEQNPYALEKFFNLYSLEIYNFPIKVFQFKEEDAGDFFIFAFERLRDGKRLKTFKGDSTFKTWFYSVLRNLVIDFIRQNKKFKSLKILNYESLSEIESKLKNETSKIETLEEQFLQEKFYNILNSLEFNQRIVFKLTYIFYLQIDEIDLQILKKNFYKSNYEIFEFLSDARNYLVGKNLKLENKIDRLSRMHLKLIDLKEQQKRLKNQENTHLFDAKEIENKIIKKIKNRNQILSYSQDHFYVLRVPFYKIAKFLDLTTPTVSNLYKKAEKILRNSEELKKFFIN
ncbi:MAG: RNA polymerase sigma factor [Leptonema sp. (in: bacteria)]